MMQLALFRDSSDRIVNVAQVPKRSPFRYPGGKTWLIPRIRAWLASRPVRPTEFVEPFAGGGIVSLTVAFEKLADHVTMVELDEDVAAVWRTILEGNAEWLANEIATFTPTAETIEALLAKPSDALHEKAFRTMLRNRVNHGGILAPGASMVRYGENGRGLQSRWYPSTLKRRILSIAAIRERITFIEGDGLQTLKQHMHRADAFFFIDPPYTASQKKAGTRLYRYYDIDHEELFRITAALAGDFLMTYDNAQEVHALAHRHKFDIEVIPMMGTHLTQMTELMIGRDLTWARK